MVKVRKKKIMPSYVSVLLNPEDFGYNLTVYIIAGEQSFRIIVLDKKETRLRLSKRSQHLNSLHYMFNHWLKTPSVFKPGIWSPFFPPDKIISKGLPNLLAGLLDKKPHQNFDYHKKQVGAALEKQREILNIDINLIAEDFMIPPGMIREIESGKIWPSLDFIFGLAAIYGYDLDELLTDAFRSKQENGPSTEAMKEFENE